MHGTCTIILWSNILYKIYVMQDLKIAKELEAEEKRKIAGV